MGPFSQVRLLGSLPELEVDPAGSGFLNIEADALTTLYPGLRASAAVLE